MAQKSIAITSAIEMDDPMSHPKQAAAVTGDSNRIKENRNQSDAAAETSPPAAHVVESPRENLIYLEDLGFLPMRKDPRYMFYRHPKHDRFDITNEDVLHLIEEEELPEHLELLQVSRSKKSIEVRFA